jgi:predicted aspartyl protease
MTRHAPVARAATTRIAPIALIGLIAAAPCAHTAEAAVTASSPAPVTDVETPPNGTRHFDAGAVPTPVVPVVAGGSDDLLRLARDSTDRMTVSVEIANEAGLHSPFAFLVDTGAERTVVARSVSNALGLAANGRVRLVGIAGLLEVDMVKVASLTLGRRSLYDLASPVLEAETIGADGIVGLDGLQGQRIVLDFDHNRLLLGDARSLGGDRGFDIVVRARRKSGQLILTDALVDGVQTAIVIDTGSDSSVGNAPLASALARTHAHDTVQLVSVTGQQATADLGLARTLTLGGMTLTNTMIAFVDAPAFERLGLRRRPALLLGMRQLRLFHRVAIDFAGRRILFDVPGQPVT